MKNEETERKKTEEAERKKTEETESKNKRTKEDWRDRAKEEGAPLHLQKERRRGKKKQTNLRFTGQKIVSCVAVLSHTTLGK